MCFACCTPDNGDKGECHHHQLGYFGRTEYGTVKNIAGKILNQVMIDAKFYDINGIYLSSKSNSIMNLANKHTCDFEINYCGHERYFENVDHMDFEISAS